jgi:hypothetical protein
MLLPLDLKWLKQFKSINNRCKSVECKIAETNRLPNCILWSWAGLNGFSPIDFLLSNKAVTHCPLLLYTLCSSVGDRHLLCHSLVMTLGPFTRRVYFWLSSHYIHSNNKLILALELHRYGPNCMVHFIFQLVFGGIKWRFISESLCSPTSDF